MWIYHNNQHGNTLTLYSFIYIVLKRVSLFLRNCTNSTRNSVAATTICLIYFTCLVTNIMHGKKLNKWHTAPFTRVCRLSICITQEDHVFRRSEFLFMLSSKTSGLIDLSI